MGEKLKTKLLNDSLVELMEEFANIKANGDKDLELFQQKMKKIVLQRGDWRL